MAAVLRLGCTQTDRVEDKACGVFPAAVLFEAEDQNTTVDPIKPPPGPTVLLTLTRSTLFSKNRQLDSNKHTSIVLTATPPMCREITALDTASFFTQSFVFNSEEVGKRYSTCTVHPLLMASGCGWLRKDTEELAVLGFGPHATELLLVASEAPGVVADLLRTQTAVPVQHLERNVRVDLRVDPRTLQLCEAAGTRMVDGDESTPLLQWL